MILTLYTSTSDKNRIDKTSFLTTLVTLSGTMKTESSIINPIIAIDLSQESVIVDDDSLEVASDGKSIIGDTLANLLKANYAYIPDFNRYYFITNIVQVTTFILRFELSCDCLMSYQEEIYSLEALVTRNETTFDPLMEDTNNQLSFKKEVTYNEDIFGDLVNFEFKSVIGTDLVPPFNITITAVSNTSYSVLMHTITPPEGTTLKSIQIKAFTGGDMSSNTYAVTYSTIGSLSQKVIFNDTLLSYIKSIVAFPFVIPPTSSTLSPILIGTDGDTHYGDGDPIAPMSPYYILADFVMPEATSYLDYNPYKHIELFVPFYGFIELDNQKLSGHRLILYYAINYVDGSSSVNVYDMNANSNVFATSIQIGLKISLSSTNLLENNTQRNANGTNLAIGLISSILSTAAGIVSQNPLAVAGGILSGAKATTNFINSNSMIFDKGQVAFSDPFNSLYSRLTPFLRITKSVPQIASGYNRLFGRPLYKVKKLEDMKGTGFTIVSNYRLDGFSGITSPEMDNLSTYLENGVIL